MRNAVWPLYIHKCGQRIIIPKAARRRHSLRSILPLPIKVKSPIEMTWSDGGIRPSHPEIVPADHDIGGANSANGVLIIGEKGLISTNINDSSPMMPKLYLNDGTKEFGPENGSNVSLNMDTKENGSMLVRPDLAAKSIRL